MSGLMDVSHASLDWVFSDPEKYLVNCAQEEGILPLQTSYFLLPMQPTQQTPSKVMFRQGPSSIPRCSRLAGGQTSPCWWLQLRTPSLRRRVQQRSPEYPILCRHPERPCQQTGACSALRPGSMLPFSCDPPAYLSATVKLRSHIQSSSAAAASNSRHGL